MHHLGAEVITESDSLESRVEAPWRCVHIGELWLRGFVSSQRVLEQVHNATGALLISCTESSTLLLCSILFTKWDSFCRVLRLHSAAGTKGP